MNNNTESRVVMLANGHSPFDTRIFHKEAKMLAHAGYSVSIIVPHTLNEERDGVSIIAVPLRKDGWKKLLINPFSILRKAMVQPSTSIFHIHDSDILITGLILKLFGRKVIYDAHEDTPLQIAYQHWIPKIIKKPYAWFYYLLEKVCGCFFDAIIVAEPVIAKYFPPRKTFLVRNFPLTKSFHIPFALPYEQRERTLVHVGVLSKVRGLFEMLEGYKIAKTNVNFGFTIGGKFTPPSLESEVLKHYDIRFLGWVPYSALVELLFQSKVGIIVPNPIERYKTNYPVKMFEFMAAGLPVIASREGEAAAFIEEGQCGILVNPLDHGEIAAAMSWLFANPEEAEQMGKRGQALIFNQYNWERESQVLVQVYQHLTQ
jgi:glycosyltransferase involved in cell wall biosynthesis